MKKTVILLLLVFLADFNYGQWIQTAGPQGLNIQSFYSPDQKMLYAGSFGNGIYKSTNNGAKWIQINSGLSNANSFYVYSFVSYGYYIFAGTQNGVYRSSILADHWEACNSGIESEIVLSLTSQKVNNVNYLIAGTSDGVYISTNSGNNWSLTPLPYWVNALSFKTKNGISLFAATSGNGIFRSDDNASTWINVSNGLPSFLLAEDILVIDEKIFVSSYEYGVYLSTNNGTSWSLVNSGLPLNGTDLIDARTLTYFDNALYVGTNYGVYKSTNFGTKWTSVNPGLDITKIYSYGYNLFAGTTSSVFASFNEGSTWEPTIDGLSYLSVTSMAAKTNILFTGTTEMGVSYSDNNGSAWYPTNSIRDADKLYSLCFKGNMLFAGSNFMIFRSNNNGKTWTQTAYDGSRVISLASNSQYLFAGSRNTHGRPSGDIECSSDNGNNWTTLTTGVFSIPVYTLAVNNSNVFAGTDDGVYRSTNNGNNWTLSNSGITNTEVSSIALSGTKIFAATSGGVFRSNNNGNSWAKFNNGLSDTVVTSLVFTTNENRVFAATASGIFYTTLAGTKWTKLNSGLTNLNILSLCTDNDFIYAGIQDMGIWKYSLAKMQEDDNNLQSAAPDNFGLLQNYPNPFNPVTKIKYTIAENSNVSLKIFDILGREIVTLVNQQQSTGIYEVTFDANNYSSGIYFYRLQAGNYNEIKKMILQK